MFLALLLIWPWKQQYSKHLQESAGQAAKVQTPARQWRSRHDSSEKFHPWIKHFRCSLWATATTVAYLSLPPQYPFIWRKEMKVQLKGQRKKARCFISLWQLCVTKTHFREIYLQEEFLERLSIQMKLLCAMHNQQSEWDLRLSVGDPYKTYVLQSQASIRQHQEHTHWTGYTSKHAELLWRWLVFRKNVPSVSCKRQVWTSYVWLFEHGISLHIRLLPWRRKLEWRTKRITFILILNPLCKMQHCTRLHAPESFTGFSFLPHSWHHSQDFLKKSREELTIKD